jgi:hypothetical protein
MDSTSLNFSGTGGGGNSGPTGGGLGVELSRAFKLALKNPTSASFSSAYNGVANFGGITT